jgi:hypothetical protein
MEVLKNGINLLLPETNMILPEFTNFDYKVSFEYQEHGLGVGAKIIKIE